MYTALRVASHVDYRLVIYYSLQTLTDIQQSFTGKLEADADDDVDGSD